MKRSQINKELRKATEFLRRQNFFLPAWACWTPKQWAAAGHEADEIRDCRLGWDVTDFAGDDFDRLGLTLFTIRNGVPGRAGDPAAKDYCEKMLLVGPGQVTPTHFHFSKMEDIINRAGGKLVMRLWHADRRTQERDDRSSVTVSIDGISKDVPAGEKIVLGPGQSITLPPYVYHLFFAQHDAGPVLAGEVSRVNDDVADNRFLEQLPRFPAIEEDEPPLYLLCNEYPAAK